MKDKIKISNQNKIIGKRDKNQDQDAMVIEISLRHLMMRKQWEVKEMFVK